LILGLCQPTPPPQVGFTFTKTAARPVAQIGEVITYTYTGTNTGTVPLQVAQLVDDQLGIVLHTGRIVQPGQTITTQVQYTATALDASAGSIHNAAVVTVVPEGTTTELSAVADADVQTPPPPVIAVTLPTTTDEPPSPAPTPAVTSLPATGGSPNWLPVLLLALTLLSAGTLSLTATHAHQPNRPPRHSRPR
jgi:uncharacterized repeat protein (TIGR01451 family)